MSKKNMNNVKQGSKYVRPFCAVQLASGFDSGTKYFQTLNDFSIIRTHFLIALNKVSHSSYDIMGTANPKAS